jgi:hypothetical protein
MNKVIDHIFSLNGRRNKDLKVESNFIYNYYEKNETVIDDSIIKITESSRYKKRFIRLTLNNHNEIDRFNYNRDNFLPEVFNLSLLNSIDKISIKIFNKIDQMITKRKFLSIDLDEKEKSDNIEFYNKDKFTTSSNDIKYTQRISYLNPEDFGINTNKITINSFFPETGLFEHNKVYNDIIYSNISKENDDLISESSSDGSIFSNLNVLSRKVNETNNVNIDFSKYNAIRCGLLLEKYILDEDEKYKFLCGKFITKNSDSEELYLNSSYEDEAVRYGETYRYVVSNVFLYMQNDPSDTLILNTYLLCDHPYITKEIECFENEAPPPPNNIRFKLNKDSLKVSWDEPTDYQYDAKGYQILRRYSLDEPFTIIAQLEGHDENDLYQPSEIIPEEMIVKTPGEVKYNYLDNDYKRGKITIYSIRTIDAHGMFSSYSEQIAILYDPFEDKIIHDLVADSGAPRNKPNEKIMQNSKFFKYNDNMIDNLPILKNIKNIKLYVTPDHGFVKLGNSEISILKNDEDYKFTIFRVNDLKKYEKDFKIKNFEKQ